MAVLASQTAGSPVPRTHFPYRARPWDNLTMNNLEDTARIAEEERCEADGAIGRLNAHWRKEHRRATRKLEKSLIDSHHGATSAEKVLLKLGAHDAALAELLSDAQLLLAKRLQTFVDSPTQVLALARALGQTTATRGAAARRVEELLQSVATLRAQRAQGQNNAGPVRLRRVA